MKPLYQDLELFRPADFYNPLTRARTTFSSDTASEYSRILHSGSFRKLQGKTQLFPSGESDLLRSRLTHSLEVADIASRIAALLNRSAPSSERKIDVSIVAAVALGHDLGHPPFGHSGEIILNEMMRENGGFEGNAQTLRILTRLENRMSRHLPPDFTPSRLENNPIGLNLLYRTIASVLKYDKMIDNNADSAMPPKGYYASDSKIVEETRSRVIKGGTKLQLKTLECQIMDLADDIAYSTYDLEDCFIAGVTTPLGIASCNDVELEEIALNVNSQLSKHGITETIGSDDVQVVFFYIFESIIRFDDDSSYDMNDILSRSVYLTRCFRENALLAKSPILRRRLMEVLIDDAVKSCHIDWNEEYPEISRLVLSVDQRLQIECLKAFNYHKVINSQRLGLHENKCREILRVIFDELREDADGILIDDDTRPRYVQMMEDGATEQERMRFICDYVASMTDRQAYEMFGRLRSASYETVLRNHIR